MTMKIFFSMWFICISFGTVLAQNMPGINSGGLPGDNEQELGDIAVYDNDPFLRIVNEFIAFFIQFVAVIAVLAVILSGIQLIISGGDEEKMKKARKWFIWSLAGVMISLLAFFIINFINNLNIGG